MDELLSRILSNLRTAHIIRFSVSIKVLMLCLYMLTASIPLVEWSTCPSTVPSSAAIVTSQFSFSGYATTWAFGIATSQVSNNIYYMYRLLSAGNIVVRKMDSSDSQIWLTSFALNPTVKCLSVDPSEQNVYIASMTNPITVMRLSANDGTFVSRQTL